MGGKGYGFPAYFAFPFPSRQSQTHHTGVFYFKIMRTPIWVPLFDYGAPDRKLTQNFCNVLIRFQC